MSCPQVCHIWNNVFEILKIRKNASFIHIIMNQTYVCVISWCKIELVLCWFDIMFSYSLLKLAHFYFWTSSRPGINTTECEIIDIILHLVLNSFYPPDTWAMKWVRTALGTQDEDKQNKNTILLDTTMRKRTQTA